MLSELMKATTLEDLDIATVQLLGHDSYRKLQEEMVSEDIAFSRGDYWPEDVLARRTANTVAVTKALKEVAKESTEKRVLHTLQIITKMSPGAAEGIHRFLKRVTFA